MASILVCEYRVSVADSLISHRDTWMSTQRFHHVRYLSSNSGRLITMWLISALWVKYNWFNFLEFTSIEWAHHAISNLYDIAILTMKSILSRGQFANKPMAFHFKLDTNQWLLLLRFISQYNPSYIMHRISKIIQSNGCLVRMTSVNGLSIRHSGLTDGH